MNCNEATVLVPAYGDGELDAVQSLEVEKHLHACAECSARYAAFTGLRAQLRTEVPYYAAPASLRQRALAAATQASPTLQPRVTRWRWLAVGALSGSAATIFAWFLGTAVLDWRVDSDLANEAVANHARATLAGRLTDVASSDQHTVKPWLSARLDYSPPVLDLAGAGFPLIGGRLDYLDRQPVATLVYRYREHTIDVFVRPLAGSASASSHAMASVRGFNVAHATGAGMEWWGVSDASADVLQSLVNRLAHAE